MHDARLLVAVQRRRKLAWSVVSLIHSKQRFERVTQAARRMTEQTRETTEAFRDLNLTLEVERMWRDAGAPPLAETSTAGPEVRPTSGCTRA